MLIFFWVGLLGALQAFTVRGVRCEKFVGLKTVGDRAQRCGWENQKWCWRRTQRINRLCLDSVFKRSCCIVNVGCTNLVVTK